MTELVNLHPHTDAPTIVRAIHFDPWPFEDEEVALDSTWVLTDSGDLVDSAFNVSLSSDEGTADTVLVLLSDGRLAVASPQGVRAYGRPGPP